MIKSKNMEYYNIVKGKFISRPNRFIAQVHINGSEETCHVKNTGRCKELLYEGVICYLEKSSNPNRKTLYDLVAVEKGDRIINIDSQAPNAAVKEWLISKYGARVNSEKTFDKSRFDFYIEGDKDKGTYLEVKGVTLEDNNVVSFPDAPTERGVKHVMELIKAKEAGYGAKIMFVVQMKNVNYFTPNKKTHKAFADALQLASSKGVEILCYDCIVTKNKMIINKKVPILL